MYLSDNALDTIQFKNELINQFGFSAAQAYSIVNMRNESFTVKERKNTRLELQNLFNKEKLFL